MIRIRRERPDDRDAVRKLTVAAFGKADVEGSNVEARLVDRLRDEGHVRVSLVAEEGGRVVGHVIFSEVAIEAPGGDGRLRVSRPPPPRVRRPGPKPGPIRGPRRGYAAGPASPSRPLRWVRR